MTLCLAWTRTIGQVNELVVASDSRLSGPGYVDGCPKIFALAREDCAIGFCGDTALAYPFIFQVMNYIQTYAKARSRALDLSDMRHTLIDILNDFRALYRDPIVEDLQEANRTTEFIVAGWSWRYQRFEIFKIVYAHNLNRFSYRPSGVWKGQGDAGTGRGKKIAIAGDYVADYRKRLIDVLQERGKISAGGFDMEPFEVLRDMLRDETYTN